MKACTGFNSLTYLTGAAIVGFNFQNVLNSIGNPFALIATIVVAVLAFIVPLTKLCAGSPFGTKANYLLFGFWIGTVFLNCGRIVQIHLTAMGNPPEWSLIGYQNGIVALYFLAAVMIVLFAAKANVGEASVAHISAELSALVEDVYDASEKQDFVRMRRTMQRIGGLYTTEGGVVYSLGVWLNIVNSAIWLKTGEPRIGLMSASKAVELAREVYGVNSVEYGFALKNLAHVAISVGDKDKGASWAQDSNNVILNAFLFAGKRDHIGVDNSDAMSDLRRLWALIKA